MTLLLLVGESAATALLFLLQLAHWHSSIMRGEKVQTIPQHESTSSNILLKGLRQGCVHRLEVDRRLPQSVPLLKMLYVKEMVSPTTFSNFRSRNSEMYI